MTHTATRAHFIPLNHVTALPRRFVYLDAEAHQKVQRNARVQSFRLAVAAFERRLEDGRGWSERTFATYKEPRSLWADIDACTRVKSRTVVVAHNLAYDLRITHALIELPRLGWRMQAMKLDGGHAWASFTRDKRTLMLVDSASWLPYGLEHLGKLMNMAKPPLPPWADTDEAWEARCTADVKILAAVWRRLMQWVEDDDLGNWRPTGAGQSWSAFRHRFMSHDILVHEDVEARGAERYAAHTGRCEAWKHGALVDGPFTEWDFVAAYANVGATCDVPVRLLRRHQSLDLQQWLSLRTGHAILSDVQVRTAVPTVPRRSNDRIEWPTGTFTTTLWDHELALAIDNGARVTIGQSWVYETAPALRDFCKWVLNIIREDRTDVDPIVRLAAKHFSRALVGRFGARYPKWARAGTMSTADVRRWTDQDGDDGTLSQMLQIGNDVWVETAKMDANDCAPQVMSWVMAECRIRLWDAMQRAGLENVAYVDTDSLLINAAGSAELRRLRIPGLRPKGTWRSVEVLGPRQLVLDGGVKASGLPRNARKGSDGTFTAEVWRQVDTSLKAGEATTVVIADRRQRLRGTDRRRDHLDGGRTAAHVVTV